MLSKMISKINEQENSVTTAESKFFAESMLSELEVNVIKQKRRQKTKQNRDWTTKKGKKDRNSS